MSVYRVMAIFANRPFRSLARYFFRGLFLLLFSLFSEFSGC